jgi:hypothetical protein
LFPINGANPLVGAVAAVCYTNKFMSLQQLSMWAADPWSFWYPQK